MPALAQPSPLQQPRVAHVEPKCPRHKGIHRLAETGRGRVLGCGDMHVMSAHMLDLEAVVAHAAQQQAAQRRFQATGLVDQLMCRVDRQRTAQNSGGQNPPQASCPAKRCQHELLQAPGQGKQPHRHHQKGQDAKIAA